MPDFRIAFPLRQRFATSELTWSWPLHKSQVRLPVRHPLLLQLTLNAAFGPLHSGQVTLSMRYPPRLVPAPALAAGRSGS